MPTESPHHETDWTTIYQSLQAGEYENAARLLLDVQLASLQVGDSASAAVAAAAHQICLALVSYRAEIEWHQLAQGNAELRRRALSQNVLSLLALVGDDILSHLRSTGTGKKEDAAQDNSMVSEEPEQLNLWRRIQHLLERQRPVTDPMARGAPRKDEQSHEQESASLATSSPREPMPEELADALTPVWKPTAIEDAPLPEPLTAEDVPIMEPATAETEPFLEVIVEDELPTRSEPAVHEEASLSKPAALDEIPSSEPPSVAAGRHGVPEVPTQPSDSAADIVDKDTWHSETAAGLPVNLLSSDDEPPDLAIYCLGLFRIQQHGRLIEHWNGLKGLSIMKYLAAHRGTPVSKDVLMDVFWPDADLEAARRNLHQAIYSLRQTLRRQDPDVQHVRFENNQYLLNPELSVWVDIEEFEEHVRYGRVLESAGRLDEALVEYGIADSLYQGAFLEEDAYEDWPRVRREHLRTTYLEIADRVSKHYIQDGAYAAAIGLCQKLLGQDACYENAHRRLMRCYLAQGQRNLAIRQYQTCVLTLREELDVPPSEETVALYEELTARR